MTTNPKMTKLYLYIINIRKDDFNMKNNKYLTVSEVADLLKISYDTALNFIKTNVEYVTIGRQYRVLESKLNDVLYPPKSIKKKLKHRPIYQIVERA